MSRDTMTKDAFFGGQPTSSIVFVNLNGLEHKSVELEQPDEEMK